MKKFLISTAMVVAGLGITGTALAGSPSPAGVPPQCTVNGPVPGEGDDDKAPCVDPQTGGVYPPVLPPTLPPTTLPPQVPTTESATGGPTTTSTTIGGASGGPTLPPSANPTLPRTGSDSSNPLVMGGMALALGGGLVLVARRRRQPADVA